MVLYTNGYEKDFNPRLLQCLKNKKNKKIVSILQYYSRGDFSLELRQLEDSTQMTLLHHAVEYGNADIVQYLLDCNSNIDAQDSQKRTPLMLAVLQEEDKIFGTLLKANANIYLTDCKGKNALQMIFELETMSFMMLKQLFQHATWEQIIDGITLDDLVEKIADQISGEPKTALLLGSAELIRVLLDRLILAVDAHDRYLGDTLLHGAVTLKDLEIVKVLIEYGADVDALNREKQTPLYRIYHRGDNEKESVETLEVLKILISRATLLTTSTDSGAMQISKALKFGSGDDIELIVQSNVDVNTNDEKGNSVLHYLAQNRNVDLFKLLRGRKFDVNVQNKDGYTPLHLAAQWNIFNAMKFLLENGADVNAVNNSGATPLFLLFDRYDTLNKQSAELLLQSGADPQTYMENRYDHHYSTIFDLIMASRYRVLPPRFSSADFLSKAWPVLARLAVIQGLGTEITELTQSKIKLQLSWTQYFDTCQRAVERMKKTTIYGDLTLLPFLVESEKKIVAYVRNEELVSELEKILEELEVDSPYLNLLRSRLARAFHVAEWKDKAITAICWIVGSKSNSHYFPAEYIVYYLSIQDMENLCLAWT